MAIYASKGVTIDDTAFQKHLVAYSKVMGQSFGKVIRRQAALFCQDMIAYSRPFSGSSPGDGQSLSAKDHGKMNVTKSVYKIFRPLEKASMHSIADLGNYDVFKKWQKQGDKTKPSKKMKWTQFQAKYARGNQYGYIENSMGEMGEKHNSYRTDNGHGSLKSIARAGNGSKSNPFVIVSKESEIKKYIKEKSKSVGFLKSAYYWAAVDLGEKIKAPAWVQHPSAKNNAISIKVGENSANPEFTVGNKIGGKAGNNNFVRVAINHRAYSMRVAMAAKLNKDKEKLWMACASGKVASIAEGFTA